MHPRLPENAIEKTLIITPAPPWYSPMGYCEGQDNLSVHDFQNCWYLI